MLGIVAREKWIRLGCTYHPYPHHYPNSVLQPQQPFAQMIVADEDENQQNTFGIKFLVGISRAYLRLSSYSHNHGIDGLALPEKAIIRIGSASLHRGPMIFPVGAPKYTAYNALGKLEPFNPPELHIDEAEQCGSPFCRFLNLRPGRVQRMAVYTVDSHETVSKYGLFQRIDGNPKLFAEFTVSESDPATQIVELKESMGVSVDRQTWVQRLEGQGRVRVGLYVEV